MLHAGFEKYFLLYIVVSAKVMKTRLLGVLYVEVVTFVRLVMKSIRTYVTPGRLLLAVPLDPDWQCNCPGVEEITIGETYLFTGVVQRESHWLTPAGYVLKVYHESLVMPWSETILDGIVKNKTAYPRLIFRPNLDVYKKYFVK